MIIKYDLYQTPKTVTDQSRWYFERQHDLGVVPNLWLLKNFVRSVCMATSNSYKRIWQDYSQPAEDSIVGESEIKQSELSKPSGTHTHRDINPSVPRASPPCLLITDWKFTMTPSFDNSMCLHVCSLRGTRRLNEDWMAYFDWINASVHTCFSMQAFCQKTIQRWL